VRRLQGADGTGRGAAKLQALRDNSNFVRDELRAMGCEVLGDQDSPVRVLRFPALTTTLHAPSHCWRCMAADVASMLCCATQVMPIMLYNPGKIPAFSREVRPTTQQRT
jgi:serine palmitoyltransferase